MSGGGIRRKLRIGLAGAGMISQYHLAAWRSLNSVELIAICDPDEVRARQRAHAFGVPNIHSNVETMLNRENLDALDIASPCETHAELIRIAAARGVDVLCQKPLAPALAEAEVLAQSTAGKIRLMVHENWRFRPWYRQMSRWLYDGRVGDLLYCNISMFSSGLLLDEQGRRPALERQPSLATEDRLMIADVLIHHLDVARWLLGPLKVVHARMAHSLPSIKGETLAVIVLDTCGGAPVIVAGSLVAPDFPARTHDRVELIGSKARVTLVDTELNLSGAHSERQIYDFDNSYQESFDRTISHFVDCLLESKPFETDIADNLHTLRLVHDSYEAAARSHHQ
jgi:predicted dehydrogenase